MKKNRILMLCIAIVFLLTACKKEQKKSSSETEDCLLTVEQKDVKEPESPNFIFVTKGDDIILNEENDKEIKAVPGVAGTEFYGNAARVNYFYRKEKDYTKKNIIINPEYSDDYNDYSPEMINGKTCSRYLLSAGNLTEDDLSTGVLPSKMDEIVLYSSDKSVVGQTIKMYFCNYRDLSENRFDIGYVANFIGDISNSFIAKEMKITGIIKEQTAQVYFSDSFCDMMNKTMDVMYPHIGIQGFKSDESSGIQELNGEVGPKGEYKIVDVTYNKLPWEGDDYILVARDSKGNNVLVYVDETLQKQEAGLSKYWIQNQTYTAEQSEWQTGLYNFIAISFYVQWRNEPKGLKVPESEELWEDSLSLIGYSYYAKDAITNTGIIIDVGEIVQKFSDEPTESGEYTLAVSQDLFDRIYNYDGTKIIAVYVEPGQEAQVMEALREQGYKEYSLPESIWGKWNKGE